MLLSERVMPDESKPVTNIPPAPEPNFGQSHMGDEFDRAKFTVPPARALLIGLGIVALAAVIFAIYDWPTPNTKGFITKVAVAPQDENVLVAVQLEFQNLIKDKLWIKGIKAEIETADGKKYSDTSAPAVDMDRYLKGFPVLTEAQGEPLHEDLKIAPGDAKTWMTIYAFPVNKQAFDARKSLTVTISFADQRALVLKE
jgi:hypothetical protein